MLCLASPRRPVEVAAAVVRVASQRGVPVTVKMRAGLRPGDGLGLELAPRLEAAGVAALGVHPRAASEYYSGHCRPLSDGSDTEGGGHPGDGFR